MLVALSIPKQCPPLVSTDRVLSASSGQTLQHTKVRGRRRRKWFLNGFCRSPTLSLLPVSQPAMLYARSAGRRNGTHGATCIHNSPLPLVGGARWHQAVLCIGVCRAHQLATRHCAVCTVEGLDALSQGTRNFFLNINGQLISTLYRNVFSLSVFNTIL